MLIRDQEQALQPVTAIEIRLVVQVDTVRLTPEIQVLLQMVRSRIDQMKITIHEIHPTATNPVTTTTVALV